MCIHFVQLSELRDYEKVREGAIASMRQRKKLAEGYRAGVGRRGQSCFGGAFLSGAAREHEALFLSDK